MGNIKELQKYINKAKKQLAQKAKKGCYENFGQDEYRKARDFFDYEHYSESTRLLKDFEIFIDNLF